MKKMIIAILVVVLFVGCSSKKYFEPENVAGAVRFDGSLPAPIVDVLRDGATLANGQFISSDGLEDYRLKKGWNFIKKSDGRYIAASTCGDVEVIDAATKKIVYKKKFTMRSPVAANIKGSLLALVFDNNSLMVIDMESDKVLYESLQTSSVAVDTKIANPFFLSRLVIFPSLDGKLVVVDPSTGRELRNIVTGSERFFNNVIFLKVINDNLIAASPNKIIAVSPQYTASLDLDISDVLYVEGRVYILTKDGEIILTDENLNVLKTRKYPFAHFTGAVYGEFIYIIEKEGYIIAVDKDLRASNIFEFPSAISEYIFTTSDTVYYDENYFKLNKPQ